MLSPAVHIVQGQKRFSVDETNNSCGYKSDLVVMLKVPFDNLHSQLCYKRCYAHKLAIERLDKIIKG